MPNITLRPAQPTEIEWDALEAGFGAALQRDVAKKFRATRNTPQRPDELPARKFAYPRWVEIVNETLRRLESSFRLVHITRTIGDSRLAIVRLPTP